MTLQSTTGWCTKKLANSDQCSNAAFKQRVLRQPLWLFFIALTVFSLPATTSEPGDQAADRLSESHRPGAAKTPANKAKEVNPLAPKMRPLDRNWHYFTSIACDNIHRIRVYSRSEEQLLARRKTQCLNKYRAFLPEPVKP